MKREHLAQKLLFFDRKIIRKLMALRKDAELRNDFPHLAKEIPDPIELHPTGFPTDHCAPPHKAHLRNFQDEAYLKELLDFFKEVNKKLCKRIKSERHESAGLCEATVSAIELTKKLLRQT